MGSGSCGSSWPTRCPDAGFTRQIDKLFRGEISANLARTLLLTLAHFGVDVVSKKAARKNVTYLFGLPELFLRSQVVPERLDGNTKLNTERFSIT